MTFTNPDKKPWKDLTDTEKGALLLAKHEGKEIEVYRGMYVLKKWVPQWISNLDSSIACCDIPRVKPEPVVLVRSIPIASDCWAYDPDCHGEPAYTITFNVIDGKPDFASVKMQDALSE